MKITINMNDRVSFKATAAGEQLWRDEMRALGIDPIPPIPAKMELWNLMSYFGGAMAMGRKCPLEMTITIENTL